MPSAVAPYAEPVAALSDRADDRMRQVMLSIGWTTADVDKLNDVWQSRKLGNETLVEFLSRTKVLNRSAAPMLALNWGEELLADGACDLFESDGVERARGMLHRPLCVPKDQSTIPTPPSIDLDAETAASRQETPVLRRQSPPPTDAPAIVISEEAVNWTLQVGQVLGRYLITGKISEGSYGVVYRGLHRTLNLPVAVKVLHPDLINQESQASVQFRTEAMLLARLTHANVVRLWDFDDTVSPPYLVLEYVEGASVADMIDHRGALPTPLAVKLLRQVAEGLNAALQVGIVHRDIKPANILVTRDDKAKVADLGLATVANRGRRFEHLPAAVANSLAGTVAYLAPEQAGNTIAADHRSDIYSLGASMYHMITGQLPFIGRSALEVLMKHAKEPAIPPYQIKSEIPKAISDVVLRMMAKDPQQRIQSYDDLLDVLAFV